MSVSEEEAQRYLLSEALINAELRNSFDARNSGPEAAQALQRAVKRAETSFIKAARSRPDPEATADRDAVAASMKAASNVIPPEPPVRYGDLTDAEFAKEKAKFGF